MLSAITPVSATMTVAAGQISHVTATCPTGQGYVSGGWSVIGADAEAFYAETFGSANSYSVGIDNYDSTIAADGEAIIYCAASGQAASPRLAGSRLEGGP